MKKYLSTKLLICLFGGLLFLFGNVNTVEAQTRSKGQISKAKKKAYIKKSTHNRRISKSSSARSRNYRSSRASRISSQRSRVGYGTRYKYTPSLSSTIRYGNHNYRYYKGMYYKSYNNGFQVVHAPIGARLPHLPTHAERFEWNSNVYYASDKTFFKKIFDDYGNVVYEIVEM